MQASLSSSKTVQRLVTVIAALAFLGIAISAFSLHHHFSQSKTSFCDLSQSFNCDLVNRSSYSTFLGVPVALIGVIGYLLIFALATLYRQKAETPIMLLIASSGGTAFALYLTYLEGFVIHAWCVLCLSSLIVICSITGSSVAMVKSTLRRS
jgi:vitamin-K-epoxide reductase (warfarin-sensitive)